MSKTRFVKDAFAIGPSIAFQPEDIRLGEFTFLPWVRNGLSATVQNPAAGAIRATTVVSVTVKDDKGGIEVVPKTLTLRGPGDILGLEAAQIIRRYPAPGATDAEETFLANIEFDRPELPWLFTPFAPAGPGNGRLDPWLVLVVMEARHARFEPAPPGLPGRVRTRKAELQPLDESWACAHAQIVGNASAPGPTVADRLSAQFAPVNLSRIVCPRRLVDSRDYIACLVPAYDCGVKTGLGVTGGTLARAWQRTPGDDDEEIVLPFYDQWSFGTAPDGDFESLAKKIVPIRAPWKVGRRIVDTAKPRGGIADLAATDPGKVQVLKCALFSPNSAPAGSPSETQQWSNAKRGQLRDALNHRDEAAGNSAISHEDLPRVGPRIYAQFQRAQRRVQLDDGDWFDQLNTNPPHRIIAGLGTRVVQKDQEPLMQAAWAQVGKVDKANRELRLMQYARFIGEALHRRISTLPLGRLAQVTRPLQGKIRLGGSSLTVAGTFEQSQVAPAALTGAFRRATRASGPIARHLQNVNILQESIAKDGAFRDFRRAAVEPDGISGLSELTLRTVPAEAIGRVLQVAPNLAHAALRDRLALLRSQPSIADQLLMPRSSWRVHATTFDFGKLHAERTLKILQEALPARSADAPARAEAIGNLLSGLTSSTVPEVSRRATELTEQIVRELPPARVATRPNAGVLVPGAILVTPNRPGHFTTTPSRLTTPNAPLSSAAPANLTARLRTNTSTNLALSLVTAQRVQSVLVADSLSEMIRGASALDFPSAPVREAPAIARSSLLAAIEPKHTVARYAAARVGVFPKWLDPGWFSDGAVEPIMVAPEFKRPMYEGLRDFDREWLVPGLGTIPQTDFLTLLSTNSAFTEAFLVGLNDEFGRELLWREYPTDQRGTYFKRFWRDDADELEPEIHRFGRTPVGSHVKVGSSSGDRVVLVIRATLLKRYPDAMVMALRQVPGSNPPQFVDPDLISGRILFHAHLPPDFILVGFDLSVAEVKANGWWFVISEHPTAPRFGLDAPDGPLANANELRNEFDWDDVTMTADQRFMLVTTALQNRPTLIRESRTGGGGTMPWPPPNSAFLARALLQNPIRAAFEGAKMLTPTS
jgi:hypothetical protein